MKVLSLPKQLLGCKSELVPSRNRAWHYRGAKNAYLNDGYCYNCCSPGLFPHFPTGVNISSASTCVGVGVGERCLSGEVGGSEHLWSLLGAHSTGSLPLENLPLSQTPAWVYSCPVPSPSLSHSSNSQGAHPSIWDFPSELVLCRLRNKYTWN